MRDFIANVIAQGGYVLAEMETRIQKMYILGKITESDMTDLLQLAADHADDHRDGDILATLADLEQRVSALESQGVVVWKSGVVTQKGQTVLYDVTGDGVLDKVRYDGGRASTSLSPGKIDGWVLLDGNGNPTHTISKDGSEFILTPIDGGDA